MKIERQGLAVVDDADRDVGLSVGQICQLAGRQDFHLDLRMQTREIGEVRHEQVCREGRLPKPVSNTSNSISYVGSTGGHHSLCGPIPNGGHRSSRLASVVQPDRFRTTDVRASALNPGAGGPISASCRKWETETLSD